MLQGSLGLGESYLENWWDSEQLDQFFAHLLRNRIHDQVAANNILAVWQKFISKFINLQTLVNSFQVGKHHYDLGNDLFEKMLDKSLSYSCGYWQKANNLEEAQQAKLDLICRKLQLQKGMTLLDIGCGWGSFMKYAAENYGVFCVGLTVSKEQIKLGQKRCQGLPIKFILQDYRQFKGKFDRLVSIGMFEHVGYKNYPTFMAIAHSCLKDDGLFLLHTIGNRQSVTYSELWTNKYIFPQGMIPSLAQITKAAEDYFVLEDLHNFGSDYDLTLMAWLDNFEKNWHQLKPKYGENFYRVWKYFLSSCAGSFRARHLQLWQFVLSKNGLWGGYQSVR
jgi:cyclopropane-fatty-acyl-phospholipid synthase